MTHAISALVAHGTGAELAVETVTLPDPGPGEVRVRIRAAGVCHSDLSMFNGTLAPTFPLVLGHEAAGVVLAVGDGVQRVSVGDHVVCNWAPACRQCWFCTHGEPFLCERAPSASVPRGSTVDGSPLYVTLGLGSLADEVVVGQSAVIPVNAELPFEQAALLGCAVLTGVGAVRNTAKVQPGQSVLVIGLGGVGLSVLAGARMAGASPIIAVDVSEAKRELALAAGATDYIVSDDNLAKAVRGLTGGRGADAAFECVGRSGTIRAAWRSTRRGGQVIVVGMGARDDNVSLSALEIFHSAKTLRSSVYGSSDPDVELAHLAEAALSGALNLGALITHRIALADAPAAFERMGRGEGGRSVVVLGP
jgi:S-(hydroxymethyl)glutathione dehydrogenase/alcohol dehydrogenase